MTKNTGLGLIFCLVFLLVLAGKKILGLYGKYKRLKSKEQAFDLISKGGPFTEITGPAQVGKSGCLGHIFKQLEGVKLTNLPTPNSTYTLDIKTLQAHLIGDWGVTHKGYYFLDDLITFQEGANNKLGKEGYSKLQEYVGRAAKLGANFIGTNNGTPIDPVFEQNKNTTWKVEGHYTFSQRYSLLAIKTKQSGYNFIPTIIAIDNEEIKRFYDRFGNIPQQYQTNFLKRITKETGSLELDDIIEVIKDTNSELDFNNETVKTLEEYNKNKRKEGRHKENNLTRKEKLGTELKKHGLDPQKPISAEEIKKGTKKNKKAKANDFDKEKPNNPKTDKVAEVENNPDLADLDQINQNEKQNVNDKLCLEDQNNHESNEE